ncbi:hypothetical protein M9H77_12930 [Catharanthus roseus]|uniref:Uncharacterized protein n=1 Tax=Catharanthus roseus TaxID=4058 RepID=A0ACC0BJ00_CATRO|nr:hypothetical protein M9H77_12930 [Catharanthus roseus]
MNQFLGVDHGFLPIKLKLLPIFLPACLAAAYNFSSSTAAFSSTSSTSTDATCSGFNKQSTCAKLITKIIKEQLIEAHASFGKIPNRIKNMRYTGFRKRYRWDPMHERAMWDAWEKQPHYITRT